jgi:hypothetical protein
MFISLPSPFNCSPVSSRFAHFVFVGEADAAGEGLAAGLALVAGTGPVTLGEDEVDGDDFVEGAFELLSVSVAQPIAKAIAKIEGSSRAVRPTNFIFSLLIGVPRSSKIEKRDDDCSDVN